MNLIYSKCFKAKLKTCEGNFPPRTSLKFLSILLHSKLTQLLWSGYHWKDQCLSKSQCSSRPVAACTDTRGLKTPLSYGLNTLKSSYPPQQWPACCQCPQTEPWARGWLWREVSHRYNFSWCAPALQALLMPEWSACFLCFHKPAHEGNLQETSTHLSASDNYKFSSEPVFSSSSKCQISLIACHRFL